MFRTASRRSGSWQSNGRTRPIHPGCRGTGEGWSKEVPPQGGFEWCGEVFFETQRHRGHGVRSVAVPGCGAPVAAIGREGLGCAGEDFETKARRGQDGNLAGVSQPRTATLQTLRSLRLCVSAFLPSSGGGEASKREDFETQRHRGHGVRGVAVPGCESAGGNDREGRARVAQGKILKQRHAEGRMVT